MIWEKLRMTTPWMILCHYVICILYFSNNWIIINKAPIRDFTFMQHNEENKDNQDGSNELKDDLNTSNFDYSPKTRRKYTIDFKEKSLRTAEVFGLIYSAHKHNIPLSTIAGWSAKKKNRGNCYDLRASNHRP